MKKGEKSGGGSGIAGASAGGFVVGMEDSHTGNGAKGPVCLSCGGGEDSSAGLSDGCEGEVDVTSGGCCIVWELTDYILEIRGGKSSGTRRCKFILKS